MNEFMTFREPKLLGKLKVFGYTGSGNWSINLWSSDRMARYKIIIVIFDSRAKIIHCWYSNDFEF